MNQFQMVFYLLLMGAFSSCMHVRIAERTSTINTPTSKIKVSKGDNSLKVRVIPLPLFLAKPFIVSALREEGAPSEILRLVRRVHSVDVYVVDAEQRKGSSFNPIKWESGHPGYESLLEVRSKGTHVECWSKVKQGKVKGLKLIVANGNGGNNVSASLKCNIRISDIEKLMSYALEREDAIKQKGKRQDKAQIEAAEL